MFAFNFKLRRYNPDTSAATHISVATDDDDDDVGKHSRQLLNALQRILKVRQCRLSLSPIKPALKCLELSA
jgi:hypothetical protein